MFEADGHAVFGGQHQFVAQLGHDHVDQFVALADLDGDDALGHGPPISGQGRFLHQAFAGGHHQEVVGFVKILDRAAIGDLFALGQIEKVDDGPPAAVAGQLRQPVDLQPIDLAVVGEEHQIGVRAGHEEVLDGIFALGLGALEALAAAALGAIGACGRTFNVAAAADGNDHRLFGDEILEVDMAEFLAADFGAAGVAVLAFEFAQVVADHVEDVLPVGEYL